MLRLSRYIPVGLNVRVAAAPCWSLKNPASSPAAVSTMTGCVTIAVTPSVLRSNSDGILGLRAKLARQITSQRRKVSRRAHPHELMVVPPADGQQSIEQPQGAALQCNAIAIRSLRVCEVGGGSPPSCERWPSASPRNVPRRRNPEHISPSYPAN
jgi:hypothetical protein